MPNILIAFGSINYLKLPVHRWSAEGYIVNYSDNLLPRAESWYSELLYFIQLIVKLTSKVSSECDVCQEIRRYLQYRVWDRKRNRAGLWDCSHLLRIGNLSVGS